jgi:hypothetical protein
MVFSACNYYNYLVLVTQELILIMDNNAERELFLYTLAEFIVQFFQNYRKATSWYFKAL